VSLGVLNAFGEVPPSLIGKYDVVHFRTWSAIVKENNPSKLIHHAMSLLSMKSLYFLSLMDWLINCAYLQSLEDIFNGKRYIPGRRSFRVMLLKNWNGYSK
jgi:hypothetical protein